MPTPNFYPIHNPTLSLNAIPNNFTAPQFSQPFPQVVTAPPKYLFQTLKIFNLHTIPDKNLTTLATSNTKMLKYSLQL